MKFEIKDSFVGQVHVILADEENLIPDSVNQIADGLSEKLKALADKSRFRAKAGQVLEYTPIGDGDPAACPWGSWRWQGRDGCGRGGGGGLAALAGEGVRACA